MNSVFGWLLIILMSILLFTAFSPPSNTIATLHVPDAIMCDYEKSLPQNIRKIERLLPLKSNCESIGIFTFWQSMTALIVSCAILMFFCGRFTMALIGIVMGMFPFIISSTGAAILSDGNDKRVVLQKLIEDHQWEKAVGFVETLGVPVSSTQQAYMKAQALFLESKPDQAKIFTQKVFDDINNPTLGAKPEVMYVLEKSAFGVPRSQIALSVAR